MVNAHDTRTSSRPVGIVQTRRPNGVATAMTSASTGRASDRYGVPTATPSRKNGSWRPNPKMVPRLRSSNQVGGCSSSTCRWASSRRHAITPGSATAPPR